MSLEFTSDADGERIELDMIQARLDAARLVAILAGNAERDQATAWRLAFEKFSMSP